MTDPASPQPDALPSEPLLAGVPIQRFIETLASPPLESAGTRIGPYKLLTVIGEGGFGVVWAAERSEPIVQRVALKIIKPGMDSRQVIARFEQERQALALMSHPSIAKVFDAGATPSGRPYFVMELVQGEPITAYCDRFKLSVRHRLEVFVSVCDAVQHAHYRGIIHRDLKPSNILVGPGDGEPRDSPRAIVKVIDFGVAKAVTRALTDKTIYTESGSMIGTPEYMSPEQVEIRGEDVDTRADVYSLGVILYELLVGALPLDSDVLRGAGFAEMARMIRETEAIRPSTRLGQLGGDTEASVAANRRIASRSLSQQLRRELDLIPLKALRKDRAERYASPNDLARDIRAYLAGRPLDARQPSIAYFTRKFFSRHKRRVVGIGALACVAIVGLWATLWQADRAAIQARRAQEALAEQNRLNDEQAAARAAASAWISIASEVAGSRAFWQRVDPATLRCSAPVEFAALPLTHHMLDPAQYRITVVAPGGEFAEFNAVLLEPGQDRETRFLVHGGAESPAALPAGGAARGLHARLIPLARVTAAMAYVPAGPNVYGWSPDAGTLNRRQTITLDAFWIDPTEVSRAEYRAFLDATGHPAPRQWSEAAPPEHDALLPIVGITLEDAEAYARWHGKRLPTAFEWQAAARGPEGRRYPWGNSPDDPAARSLDPSAADLLAEQSWDSRDLTELFRRKALPTVAADSLRREIVGSLPIHHLYDNVREISGTLDLPRKDVAVLGRCWADSPRYNDMARVWTVPLNASSFKNGFRCAKSAAPAVAGRADIDAPQ